MANVFRKSSLEKISSPDQLDNMLVVTRPLSWLGVAAAAVLAVAVLVWAFVGVLPTTFDAAGYVVADTGTNTLYSSQQGSIDKVLVKDGDTVEAGNPVAVVSTTSGERVETVASYGGVIDAVLIKPGDAVTANSELARVSSDAGNRNVVVCFVDMASAQQLEEGMRANVTGIAASPVSATVTAVDNHLTSVQALNELFDEEGQMASQLTANGPVVAVSCSFDDPQMRELEIVSAAPVAVQFFLSETPPIARVFPMFGAA